MARKRSRQANGLGSRVTQHGPNQFRKKVSLGIDPDGKRDRRTIYGSSVEECEQKARELLLKHAQGLTTQVTTLTFGEWFGVWLEQKKAYLEPSSHELYAGYSKRYFPESLKAARIQALKVTDFKALTEYLVNLGLTRKTRAKVISICNQSLREAVLREFITVNPCEAIRVISTKRDEARALDPVSKALTDDEMDRFLTAAKDHELYSLFYCMFALGLRIGEALGLRWSDLEDGKARILQQVKLADGKWVLGPLKTRGSRRTLPVGPDLAAVLLEHQQAQAELKARLGASWREHGLVFASGHGTPRDKNNVNKAITRLREKTNIKPFSSHACRHTRITAMLRSGMDAEVVAAYAGHTSSTMTRTIYRTVFETELPTINLKAERAKAVKTRTVKALTMAGRVVGPSECAARANLLTRQNATPTQPQADQNQLKRIKSKRDKKRAIDNGLA
jgi:integrase